MKHIHDVDMHVGLVFLGLQNSVKLALLQLRHLFVQLVFVKLRRRKLGLRMERPNRAVFVTHDALILV